MTNATCSIWGTPAFEYPSHGGGGHLMDSPRAGGKYFVSGTAAAVLESRDDLVKARLTSWLVEQRRLGIERPGNLQHDGLGSGPKERPKDVRAGVVRRTG